MRRLLSLLIVVLAAGTLLAIPSLSFAEKTSQPGAGVTADSKASPKHAKSGKSAKSHELDAQADSQTSATAGKPGENTQSAAQSAPAAAASTAQATEPAGSGDWLSDQEAREQKPKKADAEPSMTVTVVGFVFKLAIVLGLCYLTIIGLKKFSSGRSVAGSTKGRIKVVENSALGANRNLHLVDVGSKRLLVASTPNQINVLAELEPEEPSEQAPEPTPTQGFKEQLTQFLGNKPDSSSSADNVARMMRDASAHMQRRVTEAGRFRRMFRDAENA